MIIFSLVVFFVLVILPRLRQLDDDFTKKYEEKNKWKQKIDQHFNGHHQQFGYQDYKNNSYDEEKEYYDLEDDKWY